MAGRRYARLMALAVVLVASLSFGTAEARAWCSGAVSAKAARVKVGHPARVKARVVRAYFARTSNGSPTFIDLIAPYPSPKRLTVVIWGQDRGNFPSAPERMFRQGTLVCAQGVVTSYGGVPEIEIGVWDPIARLMST